MPHIQIRKDGSEIYYEKGKPMYFRYPNGGIDGVTQTSDGGESFLFFVLNKEEKKYAKACFEQQK